MHRILHAVLSDQARLPPVALQPELLALREQPRPRQPPNALRDARPPHLDAQRLARLRREPHAALAEAIRLHLVAVPKHLEPRLSPHQLRQVEGDAPRVVRHEPHLMRRAQLHQRHRPPAAQFDHFDPAGFGGVGHERQAQRQPETRQLHAANGGGKQNAAPAKWRGGGETESIRSALPDSAPRSPSSSRAGAGR